MQPALFDPERIFRSGPALVNYRTPKAVLNRGVGALASVDHTLNPYVGCQFGCSYCYAAFFQPDEAKVATWGQWVEVKENVVDRLRRVRNLAGKRLVIGSATDPYQPIEAKLGLTREIIRFLATLRPRPWVHIQTRSPLAARDIDLFAAYPELRINLSITTDDDDARKRFEPGCPSIERRVEALGRIVAAGVPGGASLAPLLPMRDPEGFIDRLHSLGVRRMWVGTFHERAEPFRAGTGLRAQAISRQMEWTPEARERTAQRVRAAIARLRSTGRE